MNGYTCYCSSTNVNCLVDSFEDLVATYSICQSPTCANENLSTCYGYSTRDSQLNNNDALLDFVDWTLSDNQLTLNSFPIDQEKRNFVRKVKNCVFSIAYPQPLKYNVEIAIASSEVLNQILDLKNDVIFDTEFISFVSGGNILKGSTPLAHRYGGHQFGYWSGQLGDGRAHLLGEYINHKGERWELQLKGSGKTPYSRRGDGYAVVRSSVREFLCSEAMYYLGILFLPLNY